MLPLRKVEVRRLFADAATHYPPQCELAFMLQSLEDPLNVGSLFRVADGCGAAELIFTGKTPTPPHEATRPPPRAACTSRAAYTRVRGPPSSTPRRALSRRWPPRLWPPG